MAGFDLSLIWEYRALFLRGAWVTLQLTFGAVVIAAVFGLMLGLARWSRVKIVSWPATVFVEIFRTTPTLVQLIWIYYALPLLTGVQLSGFWAVLIGLGLHEAAYFGEIVRAGVASIDRGQMLAAKSIGMSPVQAMRRIILPQALRRMIPPSVSQLATLIKLTSLGSTVAVAELVHVGGELIAATFRPLEIYTAIALMYAVLVFPIICMSRVLESWAEARS